MELEKLTTEGVHPDSLDLDIFSTRQILEFMSVEDHKVAPAVKSVLPQVEKAVERVVSSFKNDGRIIYVGAGTSGRLGILDASECPPTFGSDPSQVVGLIAGGHDAVFMSREGAEDESDVGAEDLKAVNLQAQDTVLGIAASTRTPYVLGALHYAKEVGAGTIFLTCNPSPNDKTSAKLADVVISLSLGQEVVMGSTRLKAGTATKLVLNMITTTAFIHCGHVYKGMMVDLKTWSDKLQARSRRVLMLATDLGFDQADRLLEESGGSVKTAIIMALCNVDKDLAESLLQESGGFVRPAIEKGSSTSE
ncbi:N-acetylmuramic acid 6-phosphate etherase [candidate division LCP-89 bacterium B3_LCP]|uniref:N-acetylmuramic acid 6-phosphate etherase n=1 Tax=candidate division LCP-89 bacterium B3_LCP TaxID=2012998 RepID=A0A532UPZ2_UNCL8|nr:MAG: N-acetylmuramic acid 6-phosphate etherase [candidate division LCP-89 bacterium B3_LCP]